MKFLADENIEREIIEALRAAGFEIISVRENYAGATDDEVLQIAVNEKAVILTHDTDFGELVFRFSLQSHGVILLRLSGLNLAEKINKTILAIRQHETDLENAFTAISENSVRIRKKF
jgi:predicted nuclease of predicted toxin-antitoxin system